MSTTLKDIAKASKVSIMTVSRYFNNPQKLNPETLDRIKKVVDELQYRPNTIARSLATRKTNIVCVYIASDIDALHPFTLQTIAGIGEGLGKYGYSIMLTRNHYEENNCDGIIAMGLSEDQEHKITELSEKKAVIVFGTSNHKRNWVDIDNYKCSYKATEYLIKRGYESIGNVGIVNEQKYSELRYRGYEDCMRDYNRKIPRNGTMRVSNDEESGYIATQCIWNNSKVDAIVCASDALALGAVRYAKQNKIQMSEELGIIGFDGLGYEKLVTPNITTMEQPVYKAGKELAAMMVKVLDNGRYVEQQVFIEPVLKVNGTTK